MTDHIRSEGKNLSDLGRKHEENIKEYMKDFSVSYKQAERELEHNALHKWETNLKPLASVVDDFISRQAAAEVIYRALKTPVPDYRKDPFHDSVGLALAMAKSIPSAQPEPLTDAEQRIFLKAISREKEICKKTDETCPGELNLVGVCNEIERKVKGALWT